MLQPLSLEELKVEAQKRSGAAGISAAIAQAVLMN
jgi:hypothetical protein